MPLEIKILDYGDIELESSFLVLGRGCGRTRRVPTLGFLILGGPWPIVVDTGYRSNQIMETLGMRGLQFHENMIENQLQAPRRAHGRRALRHAHAPAYRPRRQGRPVPDEHHGDPQPARDGILGLRPDAPAVSAARHQASDRPAAHQGRAAVPGSGDLRPDRDLPRRLLRGGGRAHRRLHERARPHGRGHRHHLRRRDLRLPRPDHRALSTRSAGWSRASPATTAPPSARRRRRSRSC